MGGLLSLCAPEGLDDDEEFDEDLGSDHGDDFEGGRDLSYRQGAAYIQCDHGVAACQHDDVMEGAPQRGALCDSVKAERTKGEAPARIECMD